MIQDGGPPPAEQGEPVQMDIGWCVIESWESIDQEPVVLLIDSGSGKYRAPHGISEAFSPPRVTIEARKMNMSGGWALDLTTADETGQPWNFDDPSMREKARRRLGTAAARPERACGTTVSAKPGLRPADDPLAGNGRCEPQYR